MKTGKHEQKRDTMEEVYLLVTNSLPSYRTVVGGEAARLASQELLTQVSPADSLEVSYIEIGKLGVWLLRDEPRTKYEFRIVNLSTEGLVNRLTPNEHFSIAMVRNRNELRPADVGFLKMYFPNADYNLLRSLVKDPLSDSRRAWEIEDVFDDEAGSIHSGISIPIFLNNQNQGDQLIKEISTLYDGTKCTFSGDPLESLKIEMKKGLILWEKCHFALKRKGDRTEIYGTPWVVDRLLRKSLLGTMLKQYWIKKKGIMESEAQKELAEVTPKADHEF